MTCSSTKENLVKKAEAHARALAGQAEPLPLQFYARTLSELSFELERLRENSRQEGKHLLVFTDGRPKHCSESPGNIDQAMAQVLTALQIPFEIINLPQALGLELETFHASGEFVAPTANILSRGNAVITLGSGSLTDVVKHAAHTSDSRVPLLSIPTALTVTAFTSAFAVLEWNGAKSTKPSRCPDEVLWVEPFLQLAPQELSQAGFGDLLALFVAQGDWFLTHALGTTPHYSDITPRLVEPFLPTFMAHAVEFAKPSLGAEAVESTSALLGLAGIGMTLSHATTPVSGFEHAVSHGLDFLRLTTRRPTVLHGIQVALACLGSAQVIDALLSQPAPDHRRWRRESWPEARENLRNLFAQAPIFGSEEPALSPEERKVRIQGLRAGKEAALAHFEEEYEQKHEAWTRLRPTLKERLESWTEISRGLSQLTVRAADMEKLLVAAGLPLTPEDLPLPGTADEYRWALRFAPFVRARPNLSDVVYWMGQDPVWMAGL